VNIRCTHCPQCNSKAGHRSRVIFEIRPDSADDLVIFGLPRPHPNSLMLMFQAMLNLRRLRAAGFVLLAVMSAAPAGAQTRREYTGALMSFDLKGDAGDFFKAIAAIGGLELDATAPINRTLTVHLKDVPWDLALDAVLRTLGLASQRDGKVLRIAAANPLLGQERVLMGTMTIEGKITQFDLQNPRTLLQVNAPNADGTMQTWQVEWESATYLNEIGIRPNTLKSGDQVIITGSITPTNTIRLISVQRPSDGFSWGYLGAIRAAPSEGVMFVSST
jgi:hypothetical protein